MNVFSSFLTRNLFKVKVGWLCKVLIFIQHSIGISKPYLVFGFVKFHVFMNIKYVGSSKMNKAIKH